MPAQPIDDLDDPRLAAYRHVKEHNATRREGLFVLEGETLLDRLLAERHFPIASALATERKADRVAAKLPPGVPLYVVPEARVADLVGYRFHLGVMACGRRRPWPPMADIAAAAVARSGRLAVVACPAVQNPENLGAIVRIADCFGADLVLAGRDCPDPLSRRVLRCSMGAALRLPVLAVDDLEGAVELLRRDNGATVAAAVAEPSALPLGRVAPPPDRLVLLLGNEAHGLDPAWEARADLCVTIPMRAGADSLNVAVAAGILLHHLLGR